MSEQSESGSAVVPAGAPVRLAGVRFQSVGKVYHFDASAQPDLRVGDFVIVETTRGRQMGQVASLGSFAAQRPAEGPLKPIESRATGRDLAIRKYWEDKELEAMLICREVSKNLGLPIKIVKADYSFDGSRLTFLYSTDSEEEKVDTKDLRTEIAKSFRARVELKLIGPRDVAKLLGGFGACGEVRCCSRFLAEFSPVSIKMAKEQGISLNPQEITGMCGRLRCCLVYEYEQYVSARKGLPARNKEVGTPHGKGRVVDVLALKDSVVVAVDEQTFEVHRDQIVPLEEWEALQKRAAEPCPGGENCTCGLHRPPAPDAALAAPAAPAASAQPGGDKRQRSERRHQRQNRRAESRPDAQPPAQPKRDRLPEPRSRPRPERKQRPPRPAQEPPDTPNA